MEANEHNEVSILLFRWFNSTFLILSQSQIVPSGDKVEYDVDEDADSFVLPSMKPNTRYEISVIAANQIGQSSATQIVVDTPGESTIYVKFDFPFRTCKRGMWVESKIN